MPSLTKRLMLGCMLLLAAALPLNALAGDTLQRVIDFKVLKVGMSGNQPPMTMTNRDGGLRGETNRDIRPNPFLGPGNTPPEQCTKRFTGKTGYEVGQT